VTWLAPDTDLGDTGVLDASTLGIDGTAAVATPRGGGGGASIILLRPTIHTQPVTYRSGGEHITNYGINTTSYILYLNVCLFSLLPNSS